jgi:crotonobetainyl-CoA:carnitine CoA-transferase CaiB-like acyl-CoA transferase
LKNEEDLKILYDLVRDADVFIENWRPGVAARLNVGYADLAKINPRLIYISASGFGQTGIYGPKASMEAISAAMGGYGSLTGPAGGPEEKPRTQVIDFASPLPVMQGILLALLHRSETGQGQYIQCSQLQSMVHISAVRVAEYMLTGKKPEPMGTAVPYTVPSQAFKTSDGTYIYVDCRKESEWQALCRVLNLPELATDENFNSNAKRVEGRNKLIPRLERAFIAYRGFRWLERLVEAGVPCSEVNTDIEDLYDDPQVVAGSMIHDREDDTLSTVRTNDVAWEMSRTPARYGKLLTTELDGDRESILAEIKVNA